MVLPRFVNHSLVLGVSSVPLLLLVPLLTAVLVLVALLVPLLVLVPLLTAVLVLVALFVPLLVLVALLTTLLNIARSSRAISRFATNFFFGLFPENFA